MAITVSVSAKELERIASLAYEGETAKVMLCANTNALTENDTVVSWQNVEIANNGYARYSQLITAGTYDTINNYYKLPDIVAEFNATNSGFFYDTVVVYIEGSVYPHSIFKENPTITLVAGQQQTYVIEIISDD